MNQRERSAHTHTRSHTDRAERALNVRSRCISACASRLAHSCARITYRAMSFQVVRRNSNARACNHNDGSCVCVCVCVHRTVYRQSRGLCRVIIHIIIVPHPPTLNRHNDWSDNRVRETKHVYYETLTWRKNEQKESTTHSPSRLIPSFRHFCNRQYWHRLRLTRSTTHCLFRGHW